MSKKTRLCPFRKVVKRESNDITGRAIEQELFRPCVRHKCMAYVYVLPFMAEGTWGDPNNWGCARLLERGADDGSL